MNFDKLQSKSGRPQIRSSISCGYKMHKSSFGIT